MARSRSQPPALPALYAMVQPALEPVAAEEIEADLGGGVKRSARGLVVFGLAEIGPEVLRLRTTEDVFLLAWGTDQLTYRAGDLDKIQRWTARQADWPQLLRIHHEVRPKPKGRPTYHLVAQMHGKHGYLRSGARKALARGLEGHLPAIWRPAEEDAAVEVWLTIDGATAVCGLRLSDKTMRHRTYKLEHRPASLRPTVAAAMARLAGLGPGMVAVDPMCGAGTVMAELLAAAERFRGGLTVWGGDLDFQAVRAAAVNLRKLGAASLLCWDARRLPLPGGVADRVVSNPPFGKQLASPEEVGPLYRATVREYDRILRPAGRVVLLVSEHEALREGAQEVGWRAERQVPVRVLGQPARLSVWRKPG